MNACRQRRRHTSDPAGGFALLVLLGVVGVGSVGLLLAVQAFVPNLGDRLQVATANLDQATRGVAIAHRLNGAFPADLDALAQQTGMAIDGAWRRDPFGSGQELDCRVLAAGLQLRSRGPDERLGTADDETMLVPAETQRRLRQRLRLRMLRAVLLTGPHRQAGTMSVSELTQMRDATRSYAAARRRWLTADLAERATLTSEMVTAAATVTAICTLHGLTALPVSLTGAGGLMSQLGMSDARCNDGCGTGLIADAVLGWVAVGSDGTGGTDDDM